MRTNKIGRCPLCIDSTIKPLIAGLCSIHYWNNLRNSSKKPIRNYVRKPDEEKILPWYLDRINEMTGYCWECGSPIDLFNFKIAISSCAHILPKEKNHFPSIANIPLNFLELGANCGCHHNWDKSWEFARSMRVFPLAKERFSQFEAFISQEERRKIPAIFL